MAKHEVTLNISRPIPVGNVDVEIAVRRDGQAFGKVKISKGAIDWMPANKSKTAYYLDWLQRLARNELPEPPVPPGQCALAGALGGYLGACERRLGLAPGTIAGVALRDALDALGPGAIVIAADRAEPLFADGEPVDPCLACAILVENVGLSREVVAPGLLPKPERGS